MNVSFEICICVSTLGGIALSIMCLTTLLSIVHILCPFISVVLTEGRNEMMIVTMTGELGSLADCRRCNL